MDVLKADLLAKDAQIRQLEDDLIALAQRRAPDIFADPHQHLMGHKFGILTDQLQERDGLTHTVEILRGQLSDAHATLRQMDTALDALQSARDAARSELQEALQQRAAVAEQRDSFVARYQDTVRERNTARVCAAALLDQVGSLKREALSLREELGRCGENSDPMRMASAILERNEARRTCDAALHARDVAEGERDRARARASSLYDTIMHERAQSRTLQAGHDQLAMQLGYLRTASQTRLHNPRDVALEAPGDALARQAAAPRTTEAAVNELLAGARMVDEMARGESARLRRQRTRPEQNQNGLLARDARASSEVAPLDVPATSGRQRRACATLHSDSEPPRAPPRIVTPRHQPHGPLHSPQTSTSPESSIAESPGSDMQAAKFTAKAPSSGPSRTPMKWDRAEDRKPIMACLSCRGLKIACSGPLKPNSESERCKQCAYREVECCYPTESHRGKRRKPGHFPATRGVPTITVASLRAGSPPAC